MSQLGLNLTQSLESLLPATSLGSGAKPDQDALVVKMAEEDLVEIETVMYPTYKPKWIRDYIHQLYQQDGFEAPTYTVPEELRDNPRYVYLSMLTAAKIKH